MFRTYQQSQATFRSVLTRRGELKQVTYTGVFYIGLGDQFDDDRRLVRAAASALHPEVRPKAAAGRITSLLRLWLALVGAKPRTLRRALPFL
jgi:hypothetical protein